MAARTGFGYFSPNQALVRFVSMNVMHSCRRVLSRNRRSALGCLLLAGLLPAFASTGRKLDFNRDIRPILSDNCFHCHGNDEKTREAKLRLDTPEGAFRDLGGYQAIKPRDPAASEVWKRITTRDEDDVMPPPKAHKKLKPEQIALIKRWIEEGAEYRGHWAFTTPQKPPLPRIKNTRWPQNAIDHFILAKLEEKNLSPSLEAGREWLIRRLTLDLTGLPPTPAEVDAFLADRAPGAYDRLVERLLDSPRYGEHMARYWLDAARYGDTHGLHLDNERSMWPYRDWVVRAFNRNLPFDQFTIEQLAGDLLPNPTRDQQIASGFNRCNVTTSEGGSINEEFIFRYAVDRTETTVAVWMGLTAGCAVCHDHKFDPLTMKDFYSMYAFFNSAADPAMDGNILLTPPILKLTTPEQERKLEDFDRRIGAVKDKISAALARVTYTDPATLTPPPPAKRVETVWVDDEFPAGVKVEATKGAPATRWITPKEGPVRDGKRALQRTAAGVAQDFFTSAKKPLELLTNATVFTHVFLDPANPPKAIMLQFHTTNWTHRAVWGDEDAINFGKKGTVQRMLMGPLPKTGEWVRLEFEARKLGLRAGTNLNGLAFTQAGGTVTWDKTGTYAELNPVTDPAESQLAWEKENQGRADPKLPKEIGTIFRTINPKERTAEHNRKLRDYYFEFVLRDTRPVFDPLHDELKPIQTARDEFDKTIDATLIMRDLDQPRESFVMLRGQYNKPGEKVTRNTPAFLPPLRFTPPPPTLLASATNGTPDVDTPGRSAAQPTRLDFARWLVDPRHPLPARVAVNRFWQQFFGVGLVKTSNDFGSQGEPPSHPELLDWLATTFIERGWDVKGLVRMIVTSAAYRQDSRAQRRHLEVDPENRLLARGPRFRLDAEVIRDNALFVSGLLTPVIGGKPVKPYQPENIWEPVAYSGSNTRVYKQDSGGALYRRSLYTFIKRTAPAPAMTTFDAPSREQFCVRRERSNTPLQALQLMNDVQQFEAARALAQRMMQSAPRPEERLGWGFRVVTARPPTRAELSVLRGNLDRQLARYRADAQAARQAITFGESKPDASLDPAELAAYTLVANVLLNLDETLNKN
jgi:mono/diheme cytochrome c family protein